MKDQLSQALDEQLRLRSFLSAVCDPNVNLDDDLLSNLVGSVPMNEVSKLLTLSPQAGSDRESAKTLVAAICESQEFANEMKHLELRGSVVQLSKHKPTKRKLRRLAHCSCHDVLLRSHDVAYS
jgi:hypothetical protein